MSLFPLEVRGAMARRRGKVLVGPVDLSLTGGGTTVVIGPNGAGKSSLLALLHGTGRLHSGQINWSCPTAEAQARQSFVFQHPVMLRRTVIENIAYPLALRGIAKSERRARAVGWAQRVGLGDILEQSALSLSGGERQKLALARALISAPELLFLDEPCAALDSASMRVIEDVLQEVQAAGTALVLATHDMGQARRLARDVVFLLDGRVHETSTADAFFAGPKTEEAAAFLRGDIVG